jgi:AraC-like DNA-binding protein
VSVNHRRRTIESYNQISIQVRNWVFLQTTRLGEVNIDDFCKEFGYSRRTVQRVLTRNNTSFRKMLMRVRMVEAARLIRGTELDLSEIAVKVGYTSTEHFVKVFKRECKVSPAAYMKLNRNPVNHA